MTDAERQHLLLLRRQTRAGIAEQRVDLERISMFGPQSVGDLTLMMAVVHQVCAEMATLGSDGYVERGELTVIGIVVPTRIEVFELDGGGCE